MNIRIVQIFIYIFVQVSKGNIMDYIAYYRNVTLTINSHRWYHYFIRFLWDRTN